MAMRLVLVALMGCAFLAGCSEPSPAGTIRITIDYTSEHERDLWVRGTVILPDWDDAQWPWTSYACGGEAMAPLPAFGRAQLSCDVPRPTRPFPPSAAQPEDAFVEVEVTVSTQADHREGYDGTNLAVRTAPDDQAHLRFQATVAADGIISLRQS